MNCTRDRAGESIASREVQRLILTAGATRLRTPGCGACPSTESRSQIEWRHLTDRGPVPQHIRYCSCGLEIGPIGEATVDEYIAQVRGAAVAPYVPVLVIGEEVSAHA